MIIRGCGAAVEETLIGCAAISSRKDAWVGRSLRSVDASRVINDGTSGRIGGGGGRRNGAWVGGAVGR